MYKTVAVSGNIVLPQGGAPGAIGAVEFYDTNGVSVGGGALSAASAYTANLPSGRDYLMHIYMTGGNAPVYWQVVYPVSVPGYSESSEVTAYQMPSAFTVYPKTTGAGGLKITTSLGTVTATRAGTIATGISNPSQGTADGTYSAGETWFYRFITGITNNIPTPLTITVTAIDDYSQFGAELSLPNYATTTVTPWWCVAFAANASVSMNSYSGEYYTYYINSTSKTFVGSFPAIQTQAAAKSETVTLNLLFAAAITSTFMNVWVGFNSTAPYIANAGGFVTPNGYGVPWILHVVGGGSTVPGSEIVVA
jgi:hypothetical protein